MGRSGFQGGCGHAAERPAKAGKRVDGHSAAHMKFKMEMRRGGFGVARIADPPDHLSRDHAGSNLKAGADADTVSVVTSVEVVVEV